MFVENINKPVCHYNQCMAQQQIITNVAEIELYPIRGWEEFEVAMVLESGHVLVYSSKYEFAASRGDTIRLYFEKDGQEVKAKSGDSSLRLYASYPGSNIYHAKVS